MRFLLFTIFDLKKADQKESLSGIILRRWLRKSNLVKNKSNIISYKLLISIL